MKVSNLQVERNSTYINVMESLVAEAVDRQLQKLPGRVRRYIRLEEVVTYALNRLPALYASSQKGLQHQRQLATRDMHQRIHDAVRQAIVAVQVDPIRLSQPIEVAADPEADAVLQSLRVLFKSPKLDWVHALSKLEGLRQSRESGEATPSTPRRPRTWQPGTYGSEVAWSQRRRQAESQSAYSSTSAQEPAQAVVPGWDDVRYQR